MKEQATSLPRIVSTADDAYATTLRDVLEQGDVCRQAAGLSVGSGRETQEIINYSLVLTSPRERLVFNSKKKLSLPAAVARFVWMMAASDRLADIAFYEEKVRRFSDDGIAVPGSNYGQRMLSPRPGLNQLEPVIRRLKEDQGTRRAAISIYQAEDAVRESKDIPCTFGLFYNIRGGQLLATTLMRSNNAFILLPYNIFEFSLLAEVVAAEVNVPLGRLTHHAVSMHIYEGDYAKAREVIAEWQNPSARNMPMPIPEMPSQPSPLEQIKKLVILEADLRLGSAGLKGANIEGWITKGSDVLHPFWCQLYFLLLLHVAQRNDEEEALLSLESVISDPWRSYLSKSAFRKKTEVALGIDFLSPEPSGEDRKVVPIFSTRAMRSLRGRASEWEQRQGQPLGWEQYARIQEVLVEGLAARGGKSFDDEVSVEDFDRAMRSISKVNV